MRGPITVPDEAEGDRRHPAERRAGGVEGLFERKGEGRGVGPAHVKGDDNLPARQGAERRGSHACATQRVAEAC